jgi:hypothetical protein
MARYFQQDAVGANNGLTLASAWTDLQTAVDTTTAALGPLNICKRLDGAATTVAAQIDFDTNNGTTTNLLRYVGCNSAGVVDGSRVVFSGGLGAYHPFSISSRLYCSWENLAITAMGAGKAAMNIVATAQINIWVNCEFYETAGNAAQAINGTGSFGYALFYDCQFHDLTLNAGTYYAVNLANACCFVRCNFLHCRYTTYATVGGTQYIDCVFHGNYDGPIFSTTAYNGLVLNCVFDSNTSRGVGLLTSESNVVASRFTNNTTAISVSGAGIPANLIANTFRGNGADYTVASVRLISAGPALTADGYVNAAAHDFRLLETDPARSVAIGQYIPTLAYRPSGLGIRELNWPRFVAPIVGA